MSASGGFSNQPDYIIQNQLYTGLEGASPNRDANGIMSSSTIQTFLTGTLGVPNANGFSNFLAQYSIDNPLPSNINSFTSALIVSLNANGGTGGAALAPPLDTSITGTPFTDIENELTTIVGAALMNQPTDPDGAVMSAVASSAVLNQIDQQAFNQFLAGFQYKGNTLEGNALTTPPAVGVLNQQYFADRFNEFFFQLASVSDTTNLLGQPGNTPTSQPLLNFQDIYSTYFGSNTSAFENFLGGYINQQISTSQGQSFIPSQDIGTWLNEVQQAYSIALTGSGAPLTASVGQTTSKVDILNDVFFLLVKMIGVLQNVAEAQSTQLELLSSWEAAYTSLQAQVPTFTEGDGSIFGGTYGNNSNTTNVAITSKDDANSLNQTYIQTIQSRRTQVDNTAQAMQNDLNQSNDTANQQADGATTIIQNLTTILNNLYSKG